jgi:hypothetical protein
MDTSFRKTYLTMTEAGGVVKYKSDIKMQTIRKQNGAQIFGGVERIMQTWTAG